MREAHIEETFSTLKWSTWANALLALQPDFWVEPKTVYLDEQGLTSLAQYLAALPVVRDYDSIVHGPRVAYLAQKLVHYQDDAIYSLADLEANPLSYSLPVFQPVSSRAVGNAVAEKVYHTTRRRFPLAVPFALRLAAPATAQTEDPLSAKRFPRLFARTNCVSVSRAAGLPGAVQKCPPQH